MRALLVLSDNMYLTPYMELYTEILQENKVEYHILFWDKNNNERIENDTVTRFAIDSKGKIGKALGYGLFRKAILREIELYGIDFLIPLHPIVSFLIQDILCRKYDQRFIFDVRDYSYEKFKLIRKMEEMLVSHSRLNVISSPGYKSFLPKGTYYTVHNIPTNIPNEMSSVQKHKDRIIISYIGLIRFIEQNKRIIDFFANDARFELRFYGTRSEELKEYCDQMGIENVRFKGTFDSSETPEYFRQTDFVMNLYGNHTPLLDYALSNKLYNAAIMKRPILVCRDTYMEKVSTKWGFGYVLDLVDPKEKDELVLYYYNLNIDELTRNCSAFLNEVQNEQAATIAELKKVLS